MANQSALLPADPTLQAETQNLPEADAGESSAPVSALEQLAARCGIQPKVQDNSGEEHATGPELPRALLRVMRFEVDTDAQAEAALAQLETQEWARALPPVQVAYTDAGSASVPVSLPQGTGALRWTLRLEDEEVRSGQVMFSELPLLDEREIDGRPYERRQLSIPPDLPWGYHRLSLEQASKKQADAATVLIVTPGKCWLPETDEGERLWGLAANLFQLRSERNWGIGDFTDLQALVKLARERGADALGLNPLHAMFLDKPEDASPYSPSDRTLLNVLYIDVEAIPELAHAQRAQQLIAAQAFQQKLADARRAELVQYTAVAELKLQVLRLLFEAFEERKNPDRLQAFEAFHQERRAMLDRACVFQAMRAFFAGQDPPRADCGEWPEAYRSADSSAVAAFAKEHAELVRFHLWLQWIADTQLKAAADAAKGMAIGLYRDVAVGAHPSGAEIWSHPDELAAGAGVGAPPDALGPAGQNWGLPPLHPIAAREHAYSSFIGLLRANMRYAGGLRIDHAMALQRLYWIPKGNEATHGAYVYYAMHDLMGILALESQRHQCLVVGEDLGTVPEGFRDRMAEANILSYRVLFFEREKQAFLTPDQYPRLAVSVASNHDLPTLRGLWQGNDIDRKDALNLLPEGSGPVRQERSEDHATLTALLQDEGLLPANTTAATVSAEAFGDAAHAFLARTNCLLTLVELDDITGEPEQVNVPGTSSENPNWRRRSPLTLEQIGADPRFARVAETMSKERRAVLV